MKGTFRGSRSHFLLSILALSILAFISAAASRPAQGPRSSDTGKYRAWLEKEVRHELVMLPYYSVFDNLAFKIEGDRVTLLGQVVRPSTKADAEARVKKIEGVTGVINQIEVLPASPMDDQLRWRLYRAIYSEPMLQKYAIQAVPPIHIIVKNGHVTLEGVVESESDKNVAIIRASGVSGTFSVTNNLRVEK